MKFIVDRQTWFRGEGGLKSRLLNKDGQRCCIGFVASQCGVPDEQLLDTSSVHSMHDRAEFRLSLKSRQALPKWMHSSGLHSSGALYAAYSTNDWIAIPDADRESQLKAIFSEHGDEIEFIN